MDVLTANAGFCLGITRAYREMNERALAETPFTVAHQNAGGEFDTLSRIERRDPELLARYPGLNNVSVSHDVSTLGPGDRLVLGFHGLNDNTKESLATRGVDLLDDLICPFIAKLDRVVERLAGQGFDIPIVGKKGNHHCRVAEQIAKAHQRSCYVIERADEIDALPRDNGRSFALVGQVTGNTDVFQDVMERIRTSDVPVKIVKTMCSDSYARQKTAADLARVADLVILLDDGGGAAQKSGRSGLKALKKPQSSAAFSCRNGRSMTRPGTFAPSAPSYAACCLLQPHPGGTRAPKQLIDV
jgi:4-hydroxy-3-methylbut-2-en-1-yl diphosphate reductase